MDKRAKQDIVYIENPSNCCHFCGIGSFSHKHEKGMAPNQFIKGFKVSENTLVLSPEMMSNAEKTISNSFPKEGELLSNKQKSEEWEERFDRVWKNFPYTLELKSFISSEIEIAKEEAEKSRWVMPCKGCPDGHPSFWKTIIESDEWKEWEKENSRRMTLNPIGKCFDTDESRDLGAFGVEHRNEFFKFLKESNERK